MIFDDYAMRHRGGSWEMRADDPCDRMDLGHHSTSRRFAGRQFHPIAGIRRGSERNNAAPRLGYIARAVRCTFATHCPSSRLAGAVGRAAIWSAALFALACGRVSPQGAPAAPGAMTP